MAETTLCLLHTENDGTLSRACLEALGAAKALGSFSVGLIGGDVKAAADSIAGCGAAKILAVSGEDYKQARYGTDAAASEALCRAAGATIVVAPATSRFSRVLAGVARRLNGRFDSHATGLAVSGSDVEITRWYYRQRMEAALKRTQRPWIITVDPGNFAPLAPAAGSASVEAVKVDLKDEAKRTQVTGIKAPAEDQQTIRPDAAVLFVAGAGWTKKQADGKIHSARAGELILSFLRGSKASLGGSKSVVDMQGEGEAALPFMTHLNQVGQTGSTPRHKKGLATCCHGEEPHVVGWRFISERRAVNLDAGCGWAKGKADVLYVADAFEVMTKVNALLGGK